jgi:hypothetical protein
MFPLKKNQQSAATEAEMPKTTVDFTACMGRFLASVGQDPAKLRPEDQILLFVTAGTLALCAPMAPKSGNDAEDIAWRQKAMLVVAFQGVSALFQLACPRSNRTAKLIDRFKNSTMQGVALKLLDCAGEPDEATEKLIVDAGTLYARIAATQNRLLRELDIHWTKYVRSPDFADTERLFVTYEEIYRQQERTSQVRETA